MPIGLLSFHLVFRGRDGSGYWLPELYTPDLLFGFLSRK